MAARRKQLSNRPLIREQAFGEALNPAGLEPLARYEVHLDRKLERTLSMLLRLQELRRRPADTAQTTLSVSQISAREDVYAPGGQLPMLGKKVPASMVSRQSDVTPLSGRHP